MDFDSWYDDFENSKYAMLGNTVDDFDESRLKELYLQGYSVEDALETLYDEYNYPDEEAYDEQEDY